MLNRAKERAEKLGLKINVKKSENEEIPFEDDFFDAIICTAVIHCVETKEKRQKIIEELYRVLKPKGKIEIEVWNRDSPRFSKFKLKEKFINWTDKGKRYYYLYERDEIIKQFEKVGFKILKEIPHGANIIFVAKKNNNL